MKKRILSKEELNKIKNLYEKKKLSTVQIGKIMNLGDNQIFYYLNKLNIEVRSRSEAAFLYRKKERSKDKETKLNLAIQDYKNKKESITSACKKYGLNKSTLVTHLKLNNIKIRTYKQELIIKSKRDQYNSTYFNKINTSEKVYWLGFLYADGYVSKNKYCLGIKLKRGDKYHLKKFAKIFKAEIKDCVTFLNGKKYKQCYCEIYCTYLCRQVIKLGILPKKTYKDNYKIFKNIPIQYLNHFIRGVFDGDGSTKGGEIQFSGRRLFLKRIRKILVTELGLNKNKLIKMGSIYSLAWGVKSVDSINLISWLYRDSKIHLLRKYKLLKQELLIDQKSKLPYRHLLLFSNKKFNRTNSKKMNNA